MINCTCTSVQIKSQNSDFNLKKFGWEILEFKSLIISSYRKTQCDCQNLPPCFYLPEEQTSWGVTQMFKTGKESSHSRCNHPSNFLFPGYLVVHPLYSHHSTEMKVCEFLKASQNFQHWMKNISRQKLSRFSQHLPWISIQTHTSIN